MIRRSTVAARTLDGGGDGNACTATPDRAHRVPGRHAHRVLLRAAGPAGHVRRAPPAPGRLSGLVRRRPGARGARASSRSGSSSASPSARRAGSTSPAPTRPGTQSGGRSRAAWRPAVRSSSRCWPRPASTSRPRRPRSPPPGCCRPPSSSRLPVLALPAVPFVAINQQLVEGALLAVFLFFVLFAFSAWMIRSDRAVAGGRSDHRLGRRARSTSVTARISAPASSSRAT